MYVFNDTLQKDESNGSLTWWWQWFVVSILQGDILASFLLIICLDYTLKTLIDLMKETSLTLKKARSRWYLIETLTDADYANTPAQAE